MLEVDAIGVVLIPYLGGTVPNSNFYSTVRYLPTLSSLVLLAD